MSEAVLVAVAATVGDLLQGWDNAAIAGALLYIKKEFELESAPTLEGLIVAMSLIGATIITTCSGPISDRIGRRPMMIFSSVCYFVSALIMSWSPNVYVLLLGRLLDGFGNGLVVTLVPLYISETAPTDIRGTLNTLPQFTGSGGMFVAYCMVFGMSLMEKPSWRLILGILFLPSLLYFVLTLFFLPESPRWLVSKGKMIEAKKVLQRLRCREDVSAEMSLLVEGLGVGGDTSIEEYLIEPDAENTEDQDPMIVKDQIKLYGSEVGRSWVARPVTGQSMLGLASRQGSIQNHGSSFVDPLVTLFGSVHEKLPEQGSMRSIIFPNFGSMFSIGGKDTREWDEENIPVPGDDDDDYARDDEDYIEEDEDVRSPLISHQTSGTGTDKAMVAPASGSMFSMKHSCLIQGSEASGIGGGWQLAWKWSESEKEGPDGKKEGGFKRLYLHAEGEAGSKRGSVLSLPGGDVTGDTDYVKAAALVSQPALYSRELIEHCANGPAMVHPSQAVGKGPSWRDLLEPGVRRALVVGVGLQLLQQFSGINGVLYYVPQILEQAGVGYLLSHLGIGSSSASILISAFITLLMLPAIAVAMRLMDICGRRTLLLTTIPVLFISLVVLVLGNLIKMGNTVHAVISTISVVLYFCFFVMGFGPVPNILCAEIFPTKIRGLCIAICALTFWIGDIIVTDTLPVMLNAFGLAGVFGFYAVVSLIAWVFIFVKVPETKGMPLEVITEFFALGARLPTEDN